MWLKALLSLLLLGCLQESEKGTSLDERRVSVATSPADYIDFLLAHCKDAGFWVRREAEMAQQMVASPADLNLRNDYAVALIHSGRLQEGKRMLRDLEEESPGRYLTAANLGTALELDGQDEQALWWIREAIRRNPEAHFGTEWIHVRILLAKLHLKENPRWLASHTVLGPDFGSEAFPIIPSDWLGKTERKRVVFGLEYQLMERLEFSPAPNPLVADLLFSLGNLQAFHSSKEQAAAVLELALRFGPERSELVRQRLGLLQK